MVRQVMVSIALQHLTVPRTDFSARCGGLQVPSFKSPPHLHGL